MQLFYGTGEDLGEWMALAERIRGDFPGLETSEGMEEHRAAVGKFMGKRQAIGVRKDGKIAGVLLFSRNRNMICCLGVSPEHRRCGIASILLEEALRNLDRTRAISVQTFRREDEKGTAPRALYRKFGFLEGALVEAMGYPNQEFLLPPTDPGPVDALRADPAAPAGEVRGAGVSVPCPDR